MSIHDTFKKIISKELPSQSIYEDEKVIAILDKFPHSDGHFLVIPKIHNVNLMDAPIETSVYAIKKAIEIANQKVECNEFSAYRLVINNGADANQQINHLHVHIIPFYENKSTKKTN